METPVGYQILLAFSMQLFSLGPAGLPYKFIVEPPQMVRILSFCDFRYANIMAQIWPATLANAALFETLHSRANVETDGW